MLRIPHISTMFDKNRFLIVTLLLISLKGGTIFAQLNLGGGSSEKKSGTSVEVSTSELLDQDSGMKLGKSQTTECTAGIRLTGGSGDAAKLHVTLVVPMDWPEQTVKIKREEIPFNADVTYKEVGFGPFKGAKIMAISIPTLTAGSSSDVLVTFEVTRREQLAPIDTARYTIPDKIPRDVKVHLQPSLKIESNHRPFKKIVRDIMEGKSTDWEKVEAIYKYTREKVQYREELKSRDVQGAVSAFKSGEGDCEDLCALFIALCRVGGIPARTVFVKGHCYAEFYLVDENKNGHWFPCQVAGSYAFGSMPDTRYIVQKGDNFVIDKEKMRFVKSIFTGQVSGSSSPPSYQFVEIR